MTSHALDPFFTPASIALIGASNRPGSIGLVLAQNLLGGGFAGPVMLVNPHEKAVCSTIAYADIASLPSAPDLAVIAIPASGIARTVAELGARGCRAAVVISAGFEPGETGGDALKKELLAAARTAGVRLVGPNCLGVLNPKIGLNASFAHLAPGAGDMAFVSQSGAIASAAMDWAATRGMGFSKIATVGNCVDLDVADFLDYLAVDPKTRAILLYVESVADARRFIGAARFAAQTKPVVLLKGGRGASGAKAAYSHTGALAGSELVFEAAVRRAGVLQVDALSDLFDTALLLKTGAGVSGGRLGVLTNGGGAAVLAADALEQLGGVLATLSSQTVDAISAGASPNWSHRNPADILGDTKPQGYQAALRALLDDPGVDAVLALNCPTALVPSADTAAAVVEAVRAKPSHKPVFTCWLGGVEGETGRSILAANAIPTYETPERAVGAFMQLVRERQVQTMLLQTPRPVGAAPDREAARRIVRAAQDDRRAALSAVETLQLLEAYGVATIHLSVAATPEDAAAAAAGIAGPVALKILSADITHKTEVGGVMLGLTPDRVQQEARAMLERVGAARPQATIDGFMVEPIVDRTHSQELIVGVTTDPVFGPIVLFGQGGVAAEVIADRAIGLPPLDDVLARDLIGRTRVARLLRPNRGQPGADMDAIARTLVALSQIALDFPEIKELDINPLLAGPDGVVALDARASLQTVIEAPRPAITPYPAHLVRQVSCDGQPLTIRPVRADDAPRVVDLVEACTPTDIFFRSGAR